MAKFCLWKTLAVIVSVVLGIFISDSQAEKPYVPIQADPLLESWRWRSFPELKGLGLNCLAEDRDGNMWFGLKGEIRRCDGTKWTVYTPEDGWTGKIVGKLLGARDGSVYAGTEMGISRFRDGQWARVFPLEGDLPWSAYSLIEGSDGSIWAGTLLGALRLSGETWTLYTSAEMAESVRKLAPYVKISIIPDEALPKKPWGAGVGAHFVPLVYAWDQLNDIPRVVVVVLPGGPAEKAGLRLGDRLMAMDGAPVQARVLAEGEGSSVKLTVQREGRPEPFELTVSQEQYEGTYRSTGVFDVYEDRDGGIWFGLITGEILRHVRSNEGAEVWQLYTEKDGLDTGNRPHLAQTRDGAIWTASEESRADAGVNRFDGKVWTHFNMNDHGATNLHTSILATADGALWIGGFGGSLYVYRDGSWSIQNASEMPTPMTRIVDLLEASDGAVWAAGLRQEAVRLDYRADRWRTYTGLWFQCEAPDGTLWFIAADRIWGSSYLAQPRGFKLVRFDGEKWTSYDKEDGLMSHPSRVVVTQGGEVWATGSQDSTAATASFDGKKWSLKEHPQLALDINPKVVFEASDGDLWFGAGVNLLRYQTGGLLRFDGQTWTHYTGQEVPLTPYGIAQTSDATIWTGVGNLYRFDGKTWSVYKGPEELNTPFLDAIYSGPRGDLWVGTRHFGVFHFDGEIWKQYDVGDGLADGGVSSILQMGGGSVWVCTRRGISRFDGRSWTTHALPPAMGYTNWVRLQLTRDGALWITAVTGGSLEESERTINTVRYQPEADPPETEITLSVDEVSQPGNTTLAWKGADPWKSTPDGELQFSFRMDGGDWSPFALETSRIFQALSSGRHTFEVKARDRDFNEDPTPARAVFTVTPPVWQEPWFIGLMAVMLAAIGVQTGRAVRRGRGLRESNEAMSTANRELFGLNRQLEESNRRLDRERAVERVRAEVTAMKRPDDLREVVAEMLEELGSAGVEFDLCILNIIDEGSGIRRQYGATKGGWSGQAEEPLAKVSEGFLQVWREGKPVVRPVDDVLAGRVAGTRRLLGLDAGAGAPTAIAEVPFEYGTLSLSTLKKGGFGEEDLAFVAEFARVAALGYARFRDFELLEAQNLQIQEANRLKSQFLASMSHELRTPMNAILGFTRLVLRRSGDALPERQRENLEKVKASADHLLSLINDILDLSKIEAGRMDIHPERFVVKTLVDGCCATVSPLVKSGVGLRCEVANGLAEVETDQARVRQIVINLLSNAAKFTETGEIVLKADLEQQGGNWSLLKITVADTGIGIPGEKLEAIFEEFEQVDGAHARERQGAGLGLSITKKLVGLLGGTVFVESEEGKGSVFTVRIPAVYR